MTKKFVAEFMGTALLVFFGCGVATITLGKWGVGAHVNGWGVNGGIIVTAFAFGLVLAVLAYALGPISGCHVNPAVTLGMLISRRISAGDALGYVVAQFTGAILGAGALALTLRSSPLYSKKADGLGANAWGKSSMIHIGLGGAFVVEVVLTTLFVFLILSVTVKSFPAAFAGLLIGLSLLLVHLFGIPITGTSVNPARSFGPALFLGGTAFKQVWLFIVAPLTGGAVAAGLHLFFRGKDA